MLFCVSQSQYSKNKHIQKIQKLQQNNEPPPEHYLRLLFVFFEQSKKDMFIILPMRELAFSQSSSHFPLVETNHQKERKEPHMPHTKNNT